MKIDAANALSLARVPMAALVWLRPADPAWLVALLAAAAASDWLDGFVGRRRAERRTGVADTGAWLDPVCDKIFVASVVAAVFVVHAPPLALALLILVRDLAIPFLVVALRVVGGAATFRAHDFRARCPARRRPSRNSPPSPRSSSRRRPRGRSRCCARSWASSPSCTACASRRRSGRRRAPPDRQRSRASGDAACTRSATTSAG